MIFIVHDDHEGAGMTSAKTTSKSKSREREGGKQNPQTLRSRSRLVLGFSSKFTFNCFGREKDKEVEKFCLFLALSILLLVLYLQPTFIAVFPAMVLICPLYLDIWLTEEYSAISLRVNRVDIPSLSAFYITQF